MKTKVPTFPSSQGPSRVSERVFLRVSESPRVRLSAGLLVRTVVSGAEWQRAEREEAQVVGGQKKKGQKKG